MTTYILGESRTPDKLVLAEKVVGAEKAFSPYRVKIMETHYFKTEKSCMDYFKSRVILLPGTDKIGLDIM